MRVWPYPQRPQQQPVRIAPQQFDRRRRHLARTARHRRGTHFAIPAPGSVPAARAQSPTDLPATTRSGTEPFSYGSNQSVNGQDEVLSGGLVTSAWADSINPCWWPGDLRGGQVKAFTP